MDEEPNQIYKKVFEDNQKFGFENDVYSEEFFSFILRMMDSVANLNDAQSESSKLLACEIGRKIGFEIIARMRNNTAFIKKITKTMIDIAKSSHHVSAEFLKVLMDDNDAEIIMEILFDCTDKTT